MYYHGSPTGGIQVLRPNETSFKKFREDGEAHVFLSSNKAHATLYAVKCYNYHYGFDKDTGLPKYYEPYEGCVKDYYAGKSGYLYTLEAHESIVPLKGIKYAFRTRESVRVKSVEFIQDVYTKLLDYEDKGEFIIVRYKDLPERIREKNHKWIIGLLEEEEIFSSPEEYPMYLKTKFPDAWKEVCNNRRNAT